MSYIARYETKQGGSGMQPISSNKECADFLKKKSEQRLVARIEKNGIVIGESYKSDSDTNYYWYIDIDA